MAGAAAHRPVRAGGRGAGDLQGHGRAAAALRDPSVPPLRGELQPHRRRPGDRTGPGQPGRARRLAGAGRRAAVRVPRRPGGGPARARRVPGRPGRRRMEVMLGYSDSAKDVGFLAANVALYRAQGELAAWAGRHRVELTLFHGRGGALGRGGGPAGRAIRGQAPGSVAGRFKVTEQGEVIFARYGNPAIGRRHLEQVTWAVLLASTPAHEAMLASCERRFLGDARRMAAASEDAY